MTQPQPNRHVIEVNQAIVGPREPRLKTVRPRKISDYPHVPRPWLDVAQRLSSPVRMGPPICDELLAFVQHVFTEEEACVARHLGLFRGRTAATVARADRRDLAQTALLLERLATEKCVIARGGPPDERRYYLLPVMPGMFEIALIVCRPDTLSPWHRRFIELFETLYETGYMLDYQRGPARSPPSYASFRWVKPSTRIRWRSPRISSKSCSIASRRSASGSASAA